MRGLKWFALIVLAVTTCTLLLPNPPQSPSTASRPVGPAPNPINTILIGSMLGALQGCGYDPTWVVWARDRVRAATLGRRDSDAWSQFETAFNDGLATAKRNTASQCASVLRTQSTVASAIP